MKSNFTIVWTHCTELESTTKELKQKELQLQKLQEQTQNWTPFLKGKEEVLVRLKREKLQLQEKGNTVIQNYTV